MNLHYLFIFIRSKNELDLRIITFKISLMAISEYATYYNTLFDLENHISLVRDLGSYGDNYDETFIRSGSVTISENALQPITIPFDVLRLNGTFEPKWRHGYCPPVFRLIVTTNHPPKITAFAYGVLKYEQVGPIVFNSFRTSKKDQKTERIRNIETVMIPSSSRAKVEPLVLKVFRMLRILPK